MRIWWKDNVLVTWLIFVVYNYSVFKLKQVTFMNLLSLFSHDIAIKCVLPVLTCQTPPQIIDNVTSNAEEERHAFMRELPDVKESLSVWIVHFIWAANVHCWNHDKLSRWICAHRLWDPPWAWALDHQSLLSVNHASSFRSSNSLYVLAHSLQPTRYNSFKLLFFVACQNLQTNIAKSILTFASFCFDPSFARLKIGHKVKQQLTRRRRRNTTWRRCCWRIIALCAMSYAVTFQKTLKL